jgi:AbrB family looped-hinge helix DNA binding protein
VYNSYEEYAADNLFYTHISRHVWEEKMRRKSSLEEGFFGTATVGERGQVVIPAEARKEYNINPGDKLLMFRYPSRNSLTLVKVDSFAEMIEHFKHIQKMLEHLGDSSEEEGE